MKIKEAHHSKRENARTVKQEMNEDMRWVQREIERNEDGQMVWTIKKFSTTRRISYKLNI